MPKRPLPRARPALVHEHAEEICATMQGPDWNVTGNLKNWDVTDCLGELDLPVLITSGRYDDLGSSRATRGVESGFEPACGRLSIRILSRQPWSDCVRHFCSER